MTDSEDTFPIQIMSDLHLEFPFHRKKDGGVAYGYEAFDIEPAAPTLALLGDIGVTVNDGLFTFLEKQLSKFERVLYVMGNHEGYKSTYEKSRNRFKEFAAAMESKRHGTNPGLGTFHFLDRTCLDLSPTVTVLGCTLWSHVPEDSTDAVRAGLNDFMQVRDWSIEQYNQAHDGDVKWLAEEITRLESEEPNRRAVIFTHHAPAYDGTSDPMHKGSAISPGFATEMPLKKEIWRPEIVKAWAFGHTHYNCDFVKDGVRVIANQRGYEFNFESKNIGFRGDFVLHV